MSKNSQKVEYITVEDSLTPSKTIVKWKYPVTMTVGAAALFAALLGLAALCRGRIAEEIWRPVDLRNIGEAEESASLPTMTQRLKAFPILSPNHHEEYRGVSKTEPGSDSKFEHQYSTRRQNIIVAAARKTPSLRSGTADFLFRQNQNVWCEFSLIFCKHGKYRRGPFSPPKDNSATLY